MNTPKISIVVPVYNVEKYLRRCLDSIVDQTFTDFELLLIDDGSTDQSGKICDEYNEKDSRIKVFHKENGGVSTARNMGIEEAEGEWIYFMDSDDELIGEALQTFQQYTKDDCKLIVAGYERVEEAGLYSTLGKVAAEKFQYQDMLKLMFCGEHPYQGYLWNKLYRREEIEKCGIRFDESIIFNEDRLFTVEFLCKSKGDVRIVEKPVYRYYPQNGMAMASLKKGFNRKFVTDLYAFDKMLHIVRPLKYKDIMATAKISMFLSFSSICMMIAKSHMEDCKLMNQLHRISHRHFSND